MEFTDVEIGLPIYRSIDYQLRYRPYFNSHIIGWYTPINRLPSFQFYRAITTGHPIEAANADAEFVLVNTVTSAETDLMSYWEIANTTETYTFTEYFKHTGDVVASGLSEGRYYLRISDGISTWYSEEFFLCNMDGLSTVSPSTGDFKMINDTDYTLINATDKVLIN